MIGTIYNGDYQTLLPTKYRSSGPHGFREEDKFSFSHCKSMGSICCHGNHNFDTTGFFLSLVISFLDLFGRSCKSRVILVQVVVSVPGRLDLGKFRLRIRFGPDYLINKFYKYLWVIVYLVGTSVGVG